MDLASWALRGLTGGSNDANGGEGNTNEGSGNTTSESSNNEVPLTAEELRAQRLARMEALMQQQQATSPEPMDVDEPSKTPEKKKEVRSVETKQPTSKSPSPSPTTSSPNLAASKKAKSDPQERNAKKAQRDKETLLKKTLSIVLAGGVLSSSDASTVCLDIQSTEITDQTIAEILAERLAMHHTDPIVAQTPLIRYLGTSHRLASQELKDLQSSSSSSSSSASSKTTTAPLLTDELSAILMEIQRQLVSYAASCLMEPDLFVAGQEAVQQLATCLVTTVTDMQTSITFGVNKSTSSFFHLLVEELKAQGADLRKIVGEIVAIYMSKLSKLDSVLDAAEDGADGTILVYGMAALALHKDTAKEVTLLDEFLVPAANSPQANELVRPALSSRNFLQMLSGENRPYRKRSGPGLEKQTVLGLALRVGIPVQANPGFSPTGIFDMSVKSLESLSAQQRNRLTAHQEACNQFIKTLIKAGEEPRNRVMDWFRDALLVNHGADAMRPDPTKVSSSSMLVNMSAALLNLCEPLVLDADNKIQFIKPSFVSAPSQHGGVFEAEGDHAVARLGSRDADNDDAMMSEYNPKNKFISPCVFFCARALHYGISPALSQHESLLRHIMYQHHDMRNAGRDIRSDPSFGMLLCRQRAAEVSLFEPSNVMNTLQFCDFLARLLSKMDDSLLRTMPEDFINDSCSIIMSIAKLKSELLKGTDLRHMFQMAVKMLSPQYGPIVRNYNLRAMLGDVLHDLFLPPSRDEQRKIPESIWTDPKAGGRTYLLSDKTAQESLAPSLLLLYGEVEHTGYFEKMSHRSKIASLIKYLWESSEHRSAFRCITENKESFIKFANGIMNETNTLIATVMQKLPEIRIAQEQMKNAQEWSQLSEEAQSQISSRLDDNEREVKHALPLANRTLQMFSYLNTDPDIRKLFLLEELCSRLVTMLLHVLVKLVGSKGLELKVENPDQYEFRPKEMLRDLCSIFALFSTSSIFQEECAKAGCNPDLLRDAAKPIRKFNLLTGELIASFEALPDAIDIAYKAVSADNELFADAPDEFLDEIMATFMKDPVILPSGHYVDRATITQHLLNDPIDPFSREPCTVNDIKPASELKARMDAWVAEKRMRLQDTS